MTNQETIKLTSQQVEETFLSCLFKEGEDSRAHIKVEGITINVGFHPGRIEENKEKIRGLLMQLPDSFKKSGEGGMSFLNACEDKEGNHWTDTHQRMEQLFLLGIAIGKVISMFPRELWSALPGRMPYYIIED